jgi:fibronectin-binding autotransporter adhesin
MKTQISRLKIPVIATVTALGIATIIQSAAAATNYLNVASVTSGGTYGLDNDYWNTTSETATPLALYTATGSMYIGQNPSDYNGFSFTISFNYSASTHVTGGTGASIIIGSTNTVVTFSGADNDYLDAATTISVAQGSTLIEDVDWDALGLNFDNQNVTLNGGGTITFQTPVGNNDNKLITENMPGGTVNLESGLPSKDYFNGGYTLTAGSLIFSTSASSAAFGGFGTGTNLTINGGIIDNTSGSPMVLTWDGGGVGIGGNFAFTGSSSLSFGAAPVTLTASPTIAVKANTLSFGSAISGAGFGVTMIGPGTMQLAGANTYSGPTMAMGGTLQLTNSGAIAGSLLVSNANFDISGLATPQMTLSSLSLSTSPALTVSEPSGSITNIIATTLTVDGSPVTVNVTALPPITRYPSIFPILEATTVNGALNCTLGTLPQSSGNAYQGYMTVANGLAELVLTNGPTPVVALTWTGSTNGTATGTWDIQNTFDWVNSGNQSATFNDGDPVTFNDTATGSNLVNMVTTVAPSELTVNNNAVSYRFTGSHLANNSPGTLTLNKQGSGTLTLQENGDSFSGGVNVSGGTLVVDNNSGGITGGTAIGSGATVQLGNNDTGDQLPQGNVTVNGSLVFNCADNATSVGNTLMGSGTVMQIGTNTVVLNDNLTSSGNWSTLIENGTLQVQDNAGLGSLPGGSVTVTNGGTFDLGDDSTVNDANFGAKQFIISGPGVNGAGAIINSSVYEQENAFQKIELTNDATVGGPSRWDIRSGSPQLNLEGFTLTVTNISELALVSATVTPGNIVIQNGGNLSFQLACTVPNSGTITVENGGYLSVYESSLGSITRNVVLNGGGLTNISAANESAYLDSPILMQQSSTFGNLNVGDITFYDGAISDGGNGLGVSFGGLGTNHFSGTNTYTGSTAVNGVTVGLNAMGSISASSQIIVTNSGIFDVSRASIPFTGTNTLVLGDDVNGQGTLILGATVMTNFNSLILNNPILNMIVGNPGNSCITVATLNLGDGSHSGSIDITALPPVLSILQFPLIKYANATGTYNLSLGSLPSGYSGNLVNNTANHSIDLLITQQAPGVWNGGGAPNNFWSDSANWGGSALTGTDPLIFTGTAGLNNTNDTGSETATALTFWPTAGSFVLNGNGVALTGDVTNLSTATETINLPLSSGSPSVFNGAAGPLIIGGGVTNTASTTTNFVLLDGTGVLTNLLYSLNPTGTNVLALNAASANWTILDNPSSVPMTIPWTLQISNGTLNFGNAGSAPNLASLTIHNVPADNQLGNLNGATAALNITNGILSLNTLNTAQAVNSTGIVNVAGGTLNLGPIGAVASDYFQGANGGNTDELSVVTISGGGTMNMGSAAAPHGGSFFVASRGDGVLTVSGHGALNCAALDVSRNAQGSTFSSVGVVNLDGGSITATRVGSATANSQAGPASNLSTPSAAFNFNGGTLRAAASSTNFYQGSTASPAIPITSIVQAGGAVIDSSNFAITVLEPLQHDSTLGATPDGGLTALGSGTLTLTAASTYTGPTVVSGGTLAVNGSLADTSGTTVEPGGTLAGTGSLTGNVTVNAGGAIAPGGVGAIGALTVAGNVSLSGNAEMDVSATPVTNDVLSAGGAITYGGTLTVGNVAGTLALGNSFTLFKAAGYSGIFTATNLPALNAGLVWNWNPATATLSIVQGGSVPPTVSPVIKGFSIAGANATISGTNAQAGATYYLLTSTNLLLPVSQWTAVATNVAAGANNFSFIETNAVTPNSPKQFYILSSTNN